MNIRRGTFNIDDLVRLPDRDYVVLASGGPLMWVVAIEGDQAVVEWSNASGGTNRQLLPIVTLRSLVRYVPPERRSWWVRLGRWCLSRG